MIVVILAGGRGTRISEFTKLVPKPMIPIKNTPIIIHIMKHYSKFGFNDFIIATGYKGEIIKKYFTKNKNKKWNVKIVNTGKDTMTGGRLKRLKKYLKNRTFMCTYGDGLSTVNIRQLLKFHKKNNNHATLTAVRPPARFGAIKIVGKKVSYFKEKSSLDEGWINGGFFVFESQIFNHIKGDKTFLERTPMENFSKIRKLGAFKHRGFWQCMDTVRDKEILEKSFKKKKNLN